MKNMCRTALVALVTVLLSAFASHAAEQKTTSLEKRLVGAWAMTGNVLDQDGKKSEPFGPNAKGNVIFTSGKRVAVIITRADLPKIASNNRTTGTPEENKAVAAGSIAYFGTYEVNDADKLLTMHLEGSTFPNWSGTDQKRIVALSGDEMTVTNPTPSIGPGTATLVWKRAKDARQTAQR